MKRFAILVSFLIGFSAFAGGFVVVGRGAGSSEQALVYAMQNYGELIAPCLRAGACGLAVAERELAAEIQTNLPQEKNELQFLDSETLGTRVFDAGSAVGDVLRVNKDLLWREDGQAYLISDALNLVALAYAVHHPRFSESVRISFAKKVSQSLLNGRAKYVSLLGHPSLRVLILNGTSGDTVILDDGVELFARLDLMVAAETGCEARDVHFYSVNWNGMLSDNTDPILISMNARVGWKCAASEVEERGTMTLLLKTVPSTGSVDDFWRTRLGKLIAVPENPIEIFLNR